jgi:hypothetical protein
MIQLTPGDLIAVAAIVLGFGVVVVMFRVQREIEMQTKGEQTWIARSDYLVLFSIVLSALFVLLPILAIPGYRFTVPLARAGCVAAVILEVGYIPAILAHYRLGFGKNRSGPRDNPEPMERLVIWATTIFAALCFCGAFWASLFALPT